MKKRLISKKEYAKICLDCPYKVCHNGDCDRLKTYRVIREKEEKNEKKEDY